MKKQEIVKMLKRNLSNRDVDKIILFGSFSRETNNPDSDIDILVVTKDNSIPKSFSEKMAIKMPIANALSPLRKFADIDLLVYTRPMYQKFVTLDSGLKREIEQFGTLVYEADN